MLVTGFLRNISILPRIFGNNQISGNLQQTYNTVGYTLFPKPYIMYTTSVNWGNWVPSNSQKTYF
jgi:hypothetical protein